MEPPHLARVSSPEDNVRILEGLAENGEHADPQISEKVRQLKEWYAAKRADGGVGGDATEARKYELAYQIWGGEEEEAPAPAQPKVRAEPRGFEEMQRLYPNLAWVVEGLASRTRFSMLEGVLKWAFEVMDDEKAAELEAKARKQRIMEAKAEVLGSTLSVEVHQMVIAKFSQ